MADFVQSLVIRNDLFNSDGASRIPEVLQDRYGSGLGIPLRVRGSRWDVSKTEIKITESIFIILTTPLGSRLFRPDFGSMLPHMIFNPIDANFRREIKVYSKNALEKWEPRINVTGVAFNESDIDAGFFGLILSYSIKGTESFQRTEILLNFNQDPKLSQSSRFTLGGLPIFV